MYVNIQKVHFTKYFNILMNIIKEKECKRSINIMLLKNFD